MSVLLMLEMLQAETPEQLAQIRALFLEYAASLGFSLSFQFFDEELAGLPEMYAPPEGRLLIAYCDGEAVGCAALRTIDRNTGEVKRLYVRSAARGKGIGRMLSERILREARLIGYQRVRLDTIENQMQTAVALYRAQGFLEIEPYRENPIPGALYMELELT